MSSSPRKLILVTGGARSGKSLIAERIVSDFEGSPIYLATAEPKDAEMMERITLHQERRGPEWKTVSVPKDLPASLRMTDNGGPRLVDCLTIWLSNIMIAGMNYSRATDQLVAVSKSQNSPLIFVTNEVGAGIVPENELARRFRDAAGLLNQAIAGISDEVYLAVAGVPVKVK